jgi:hypothetical protein
VAGGIYSVQCGIVRHQFSNCFGKLSTRRPQKSVVGNNVTYSMTGLVIGDHRVAFAVLSHGSLLREPVPRRIEAAERGSDTAVLILHRLGLRLLLRLLYQIMHDGFHRAPLQFEDESRLYILRSATSRLRAVFSSLRLTTLSRNGRYTRGCGVRPYCSRQSELPLPGRYC